MSLCVISRFGPRLLAVGAVILASTAIVACGSSSSSSSNSSGSSGSGSSQSHLQQEALSFAHCMRSHGVSSFPDPTANGAGFNVDVAGVNPSSPAFRTAQAACRLLMPVKVAPSEPPTRQEYTRLMHWASCMRAHGISGLSDPKPLPPPSPGSPGSNLYGTVMGDGGYWVGIPISTNAHSPAFTRLATACGESPNGHHG
jgi:hypothetical protein